MFGFVARFCRQNIAGGIVAREDEDEDGAA